MDDDALVAALRAAFPDLQAAYVFGSRARGDAVAGSDLDVAILLPRPLDPVRRWDLQEQLATAAHTDVDLVDLRTASTVLRVNVLDDGRLLWEGDRYARELFEAIALSSYARLNEERRAILEQVAKDGRVYG